MEEKEKIKVQIDELRVARGDNINAISASEKLFAYIENQIRDLAEELAENKEQIETLNEVVDENESDLKSLKGMLAELKEEDK